MADKLAQNTDDQTPGWRRLDAAGRARVHGLGPVLLLADHLDASLALLEDIGRMAVLLPDARPVTTDAIRARSAAASKFAQEVRSFELAATSRILQARKRAQLVMASAPDVQRLVTSFVGGTAILADAVETDAAGLGPIRPGALLAAPDVLAYLKARGVIADDAVSFDEIAALSVTEDLPLLGLIPLGPLMDMIAAFLDALDVAFDLYAPGLASALDRDDA